MHQPANDGGADGLASVAGAARRTGKLQPMDWIKVSVRVLIISTAVWGLCIVALALALDRMVAAEYASGARTTTDGDSIGLPVGIFVLMSAPVWLLVNVVWIRRAVRRRNAAALLAALRPRSTSRGKGSGGGGSFTDASSEGFDR